MASLLLHGLVFSWEGPGGGERLPAGRGAAPLQLRLAAARLPEPAAAALRASPPRERAERPLPSTAEPLAPSGSRFASEVAVEPAPLEPALPAAAEAAGSAVSDLAMATGPRGNETSPELAVGGSVDDYVNRIREAAGRLKRYPARARRFGLEGTAVVALVGGEGDSRAAAVLVSSSGIALLDRAAIDLLDRAVRQVGEPGQLVLPLRFPVSYSLQDGR